MKLLRTHLPFIIIVPLLIIVMTWPTLRYVFDAGAFWLPTQRDDIYMLFWDAWYGGQILANGADFYFTDLKFHPAGVSLAYHNFSLPHMALLGGLSAILPRSSAFNLAYLLLVFASALSGYVYMRYLLRDRWLSLFGAIVFGSSAFVLARPATPHISFIASLPLSLYFLHRGFAEARRAFLIAAALLTGFTAFIGLYMLVCLLITVALYLLCFARARWRQPSFWANILIVVLIVGAIGALRIVPMLADPDSLSSALTKYIEIERGRDLLGYLVNYENPYTAPLLKSWFASDLIENGWRQMVYLGYIPMLLIAFGLASRRFRPKALPWLALLLVFLLLRLGSTLQINDAVYESIRLPKYYLAQIFPQVFQPFWTTDQFFAGAVFPLALLACLGMKALLQRLPRDRRAAIVLAAAGLIAFEYYQAPDPLLIPPEQLAFLSEIDEAESQDSINLIHLPMGGNLSKIYDFYQTYNGYPQVEGRPTRTPPTAFDYIDENMLLRTWRRYRSIICLPAGRAQYLASLHQLESDGFTHIVFHHWLGGSLSTAPSFVGIQPAYADSFARVYPLALLKERCADPSIPLPPPFSFIADLARSPVITADQAMTVLSFHPSEGINDETLAVLSSAFHYWKGFAHSYLQEGKLQLQSAIPNYNDLNALLSGESLILLVYNPSQTGTAGPGALAEALANDFQACPPIIDTANLAAAYYPPAGFDCALLSVADGFEVDFDNGVRLKNWLYQLEGDYLDVETWWPRLPEEAHGVSIQVFDAADAKVAGGDFVIHHESLARHRQDIASLAPGVYSLKLILYNYQTGRSIGGSYNSAEARFDREVEIGSIVIEQ